MAFLLLFNALPQGQVNIRFPCRKWEASSLLSQLLGNCSDQVWLKPTAAPNISNPQVISLSCPFLCLKPCDLSRLNCIREFWKTQPSKGPQSGHLYAFGCAIRYGFWLNASRAIFIFFTVSRLIHGSKRQFAPTMSAPALDILTAHSPADMPALSPFGPMAMVAAMGLP